ncbi:type IV secretion system DNA-binding domain-containing protein [Kitasatospora sp. NPDC050463]|uniref:type IV secretion system DNA-binding domain-containing protein n=1 Tax=Kitasatospora sp. NPDC050463 TaxID=3155786 RepID=UPI0033FDA1C4
MSDRALLASSVVLLGAAIAFIIRLRYSDQLARDTHRLTYQLHHPRDLTIQQVADFLHALSRLRPQRAWLFGRDSVVFELVGRPDRIEYRLRLPEHQADALLRQLRAVAPGIRAELVRQPVLPQPQWLRRIHLTTALRSLRTEAPAAFAASLISSLQPIGPEETLLYQLAVYPVRTPRAVSAEPRPTTGWLQRLGQLLAGAPPPLYDQQARADFKVKVGAPWFGVVGLVAARAATKGRAHLLVGRLMASLHQLDQDGAELVPRWQPLHAGTAWLARAATRLWAAIYLNATELATLVAWPLGAPALQGLSLIGGREFPPTADVPTTGRLLGTATYSGLHRPVAVPPEEAMHQLVIGPTGTGKSTLLLNEITQDMRAGRGVIVIDPGGDLASDVIERVPASRAHDLIYLDPSSSRPVGLNPLAGPPADAELVADQIFHLLKGQADSWGPKLAELLRNALVLLASTDQTLLELPAVLTNAAFRDQLVAQLDPVFALTVRDYFARFDADADGTYAATVPAVLNKVSPMIDRWRLRAILGQARPTWTMADVLDQGKILVVALPSGSVGSEAADLLGVLVVQMVWNAVQRRSEVSHVQRRPVSLYIDEAPRFLRGGTDLGDMLARARGHGLDVIAALQHLDQASFQLRAALLSEARTKVAFQAGPLDGSTLAKAFGREVQRDDFLDLRRHTALAVVAHAGQVSPPVTIQTHPQPEPSGWGSAALAASLDRHARTLTDIQQEIEQRRQLQLAASQRPRVLQA